VGKFLGDGLWAFCIIRLTTLSPFLNRKMGGHQRGEQKPASRTPKTGQHGPDPKERKKLGEIVSFGRNST